MRKFLLLFVAVSSLAAATAAAELARPAASATATVKITHTGYNPQSVSITVGDSVAFTNSDTVAHTVRFNPTTGVSCSRALPPTKIATVTTTTAGAYSYQTKPLKNTTYTKFKSATSNAVSVKARPRLRLGRVARHRYSLRVFAAQSFAGHRASFQRYRPALRRWITVKRVLLRANSTGVAPTVITTARFRSRIRAGLKVRVVLPGTQVGTCYLAGRSNTIRS